MRLRPRRPRPASRTTVPRPVPSPGLWPTMPIPGSGPAMVAARDRCWPPRRCPDHVGGSPRHRSATTERRGGRRSKPVSPRRLRLARVTTVGLIRVGAPDPAEHAAAERCAVFAGHPGTVNDEIRPAVRWRRRAPPVDCCRPARRPLIVACAPVARRLPMPGAAEGAVPGQPDVPQHEGALDPGCRRPCSSAASSPLATVRFARASLPPGGHVTGCGRPRDVEGPADRGCPARREWRIAGDREQAWPYPGNGHLVST